MYSHNKKGLLTALMPLLALALAGGCARQPPGGTGATALSGKRLQVIVQFAGAINPGYRYYFLINNTNNPSAPGPIPVGPPIPNTTYGNGFATSSSTADTTGGFTDFVLYSAYTYPVPNAESAQYYQLYHIPTGSNANNPSLFQGNGVPITYIAPNQIDPNGDTLEFSIDLAQLYPSSTQSEAVNEALALHWIQVNMVATNIVPTDTQTLVPKEFDSFGSDYNGIGNFLVVDLQNETAYANGSGDAGNATKPSDVATTPDIYVYPTGSLPQYPALQIINWQIQITTQ